MKNPLLAIAVSTVFAVTTVRAASSDSSDIHYSRPTKYMSMMRSPDWWNSGELTGDWGGPRNTLYDDGVSIIANYLTISPETLSEEKAPALPIATTSVLDSTLDLEKLIGWKGGKSP